MQLIGKLKSDKTLIELDLQYVTGLYIGPEAALQQVEELGITHVLVSRQQLQQRQQQQQLCKLRAVHKQLVLTCNAVECGNI